MRNHKLLVAGYDPGSLAEERGIRKVGEESETKRLRETGSERGRVRLRGCVLVLPCGPALSFSLTQNTALTPVLLLHSQGDILRAVDSVDVLNMKQV